MRGLRLALVGVVLTVVPACDDPEPVLDQSDAAIAPEQTSRPEATRIPVALTLDRLGRANVALPRMRGERESLSNGTFEQQNPFRVITMEEGTLAHADFDGDGQIEAAVIVGLIEGLPNPGRGVEPIRNLVIFGGTNSTLQEAVVQLPPGARATEIRAAEGGIIEVDARMTGALPGQERLVLRYRYSGGELTLL